MKPQFTQHTSLLSGRARNFPGVLGSISDFLLRYSLYRNICTARSIPRREIEPGAQVRESRERLGEFGDTIVEVLIAIAVVSTVLAGAYVSANKSLNASRQSEERGEALKLAEGQLERLKSKSSDPAIYLAGAFCINDLGNKQSLPDPLCDSTLGGVIYKRSVNYTASTFTVTINWDRAGGGGIEEAIIKYKLYQP